MSVGLHDDLIRLPAHNAAADDRPLWSSDTSEAGRQRSAKARRIVIVLHDFAGGGTERAALRLASEWAIAQREVVIFCGTEKGVLRSLVPDGVRVVAARPECQRSPWSRIVLARALARFAAAERPDIVFAPGNFHLPVMARFRALDRSGTTTVAKLSNPMASTARLVCFGSLYERIVRAATGRIDCLVALSPALQSEAAAVLRRADIRWAWDPILDEARKSTRAVRRKKVFIAIGRLEAQKNFELALRALALTKMDAELLILGEGKGRPALTRLAARLGLTSRVRFLGYRADVSRAFPQATALLLTSKFEGYPAVAVEAIAAGVPVLGTACSPAMAEIVAHDDRCRILPASPQAFANAMNELLVDDPPAAIAAASLVARHETRAAANAYLGLLDDVRAQARAFR